MQLLFRVLHSLKIIAVSITTQFIAPLLILLLITLIFYVIGVVIPGFGKWINEVFLNTHKFLGYDWSILGLIYFSVGPLFGILTIYLYKGRKKSWLMLFPLVFYVLYFLPLALGSPFPVIYNRQSNFLQDKDLIAVAPLAEKAKVNNFSGSALILQNNILWKIDNGSVSKLIENSYNYDFSKKLLTADNNRYIISADYSGSTIFDIQKQTKKKVPNNIFSVGTTKPLVIASNTKGGEMSPNVILHLDNLAQDEIKVATNSAVYVSAKYLPGSKLLTSYGRSTETIAEINGQVFKNKEAVDLLTQQDSSLLKDYGKNKILVNGSLTRDGVVQSGIWSAALDENAPQLIYSPADGSGIKAFDIDKDKKNLVLIKINSSADLGKIVSMNIATGQETIVPLPKFSPLDVTYGGGSQAFDEVGWMDNKIWVAGSYTAYHYSQNTSVPLKKYNIWIMTSNKFIPVIVDADNYLFLK